MDSVDEFQVSLLVFASLFVEEVVNHFSENEENVLGKPLRIGEDDDTHQLRLLLHQFELVGVQEHVSDLLDFEFFLIQESLEVLLEVSDEHLRRIRVQVEILELFQNVFVDEVDEVIGGVLDFQVVTHINRAVEILAEAHVLEVAFENAVVDELVFELLVHTGHEFLKQGQLFDEIALLVENGGFHYSVDEARILHLLHELLVATHHVLVEILHREEKLVFVEVEVELSGHVLVPDFLLDFLFQFIEPAQEVFRDVLN